MSAWACGGGRVLGQRAVADKSDAIAAIPPLLRPLDLTGATVTIDALGCQTASAAQIVARGADDALVLKDNHPTLHDDAAGDHDAWHTSEQDHGRRETRRYWTLRDPATSAYRNQGGAWAGRGTSGMVERRRRRGAALSSETRCSLLSGVGDAASCGHAIRRHWGSEHRVHWVRAVAFRADERRVRGGHSAEHLAVLRHFARNLLRQERAAQGGIATKRFRAARDDAYLLAVLVGLQH